MSAIVFIGTGHAAIQCAASLRDLGHSGPITIIGTENDLPYHRPPNSKKYAIEGVPADFSLLRAADYYENEQIDLLLGETVSSIDLAGRQVTLDSKKSISFEKLIIATGSEPRHLPIPGVDHALCLYSLQNSRDVYEKLKSADSVAVIGGGFIGLEIASAAAAAGKEVTVIEAASQILSRSLTPQLAQRIREIHEAAGIRIIDSASIDSISTEGVSTDNGFVDAVSFVIYGTQGAWADLLWPHRTALFNEEVYINDAQVYDCLLYTSPSPRDGLLSRMPSSA